MTTCYHLARVHVLGHIMTSESTSPSNKDREMLWVALEKASKWTLS